MQQVVAALASLASVALKLAAALGIYRAGKNSERLDHAERENEARREQAQVAADYSSASDAELDKRLRGGDGW